MQHLILRIGLLQLLNINNGLWRSEYVIATYLYVYQYI